VNLLLSPPHWCLHKSLLRSSPPTFIVSPLYLGRSTVSISKAYLFIPRSFCYWVNNSWVGSKKALYKTCWDFGINFCRFSATMATGFLRQLASLFLKWGLLAIFQYNSNSGMLMKFLPVLFTWSLNRPKRYRLLFQFWKPRFGFKFFYSCYHKPV